MPGTRGETYGATWWGRQWLNALARIDFSNRLPRGRAYAANGAVRDLQVNAGHVHASVQGSRRQPYAVTLDIPATPSAKQRKLLDSIARDKALIARLLNRELDPALLDLAMAAGVKVFPDAWSDLSMHCSCPDFAVPCKHIAATIYLLSREIDSQPFLVFTLRGIDLVGELEKRRVQIEVAAALPMVSDILQATTATRASPDECGVDERRLADLDFSRVPDLREALVRVLPSHPAFSAGVDFRDTYRRRVLDAARQASEGHPPSTLPDPGAIRPRDCPQILLDADYIPVVRGTTKPVALVELMAWIESVDVERMPDFQPQMAALHYVRLLAQNLVKRGAVVPQVFTNARSATCIRWLPAMLDPDVRELLRAVSDCLPEGIVVYTSSRRSVRPRLLARDAQAITVCSLFLDSWFNEVPVVRPRSRRNAALEELHDRLSNLFFGSRHGRFDGPGEGAIAGNVQAWLSRLYLAEQPWVPVLQIDEAPRGDFALGLAVSGLSATAVPVSLAQVLSHKRWEAERYAVLQSVALLGESLPALRDHLNAGALEPIRVPAQDLPTLLFDVLPVVRLLGMGVVMPKSLDRLLRPRLSVRISAAASPTGGGWLTLANLLDFDWQVAIGDALISRAEFEKLVGKARGVVRFRNEYVLIDPEQIAALRVQLKSPTEMSTAEKLHIALSGDFRGASIGLDNDARRLVDTLRAEGSIESPRNLVATLRPYQQRGYAWLYRNARLGLGSVIADDMGLGKTLQVIALLQKLKEDGALDRSKALVVVPTSLLANWEKELARFAPSLGVGTFHGSMREFARRRPDVLLTTYGVARSDLARLKNMAWEVVVIDEAQNIKNPQAAQTKAVRSIPARQCIAMSGTPVENRLSELWSIMEFANPGYLGSLKSFTGDYAKPIQAQQDHAVAEQLRRITAPFLLRRLKSDKSVISDLPDKIEQDQFCELTGAQTALYESIVRSGLKSLSGVSDSFQRQGLVLRMIMALKQVCNHPAQYARGGDADPALSGKAQRFLELLDDIVESHEKAIVFTQFVEAGELLSQWIAARYGVQPMFLHGGTARKRRDEMVERFQSDRTERVFLLSLKAGGTGLNLTAASQVIHYDLWWNPAVEAQATDRAYRIGQQRNVQVHRLITRDTFEERINELIQAKRGLAAMTVGTGERWIGQLGDAELTALFARDRRGG